MLKEYLTKQGGLKVFYKVEEGRVGGYVLTQIDDKDKYDIAEELRSAVFKTKPKDIHIFYSDKAWYPYESDDYLIADIVVVSLDKKNGEKEFQKQLSESKIVKKRNLAYLNKTLKPFLERLIKTDFVEAVIGRGDLFNPQRTPNIYSDIDITLLVNFSSQDKRAKSKLYMLLKKSPGKVYVDYYVMLKNRIYNQEKLLVDRKAQHAPSYDVISLPGFKEFRDNKLREKEQREKLKLAKWVPVVSKYVYETYSTAKILYQKNKSGDKFIKELLSIARKP